MVVTVNQSGDDYAGCAVPLDARYRPFSMGLLWITMVSGFPSVLIGFQWHKAGISLVQVLVGGLLSCIILLAYLLCASHLGASTGLNYSLLTRKVFGKRGSQFISTIQSFLFLIWYSLIAVFAADAIRGLFPSAPPVVVLAALSSILMSVNNIFGFVGVANFARYLAAPVMILWIVFLFCKASIALPESVLFAPGSSALPPALSLISSFVIGYCVWGNEPDFWRFGKPNVLLTSIPIVITILVGQIIFPISGWMLAHITGVAEAQAATLAVNNYSFAGMPLLAALVLVSCYFGRRRESLWGNKRHWKFGIGQPATSSSCINAGNSIVCRIIEFLW